MARLVPSHRAGELAYFVVLGAAKTPAHRVALERAGARVLRDYATIDAFAVASTPRAAARVARLPDVARLAPVEVIETEAEPEVDQTKGTTADVGAPQLWNQGATGAASASRCSTPAPTSRTPISTTSTSATGRARSIHARSSTRGASSAGGCDPLAGAIDGNGHGTHVAGVAAGTGEGTPLADDNGKYAGIAPGAELAVGKVMNDAGAGINSDLLAALEWAARPVGSSSCAIGAHVVNLSLASDVRPGRLNTNSDVDLVSLMVNRLAVRYGTLFVGAAANSQFIGSVHESPAAAAQALIVGASAKDYDVNHDDTLSGDLCAGYQQGANGCSAGPGSQPPSLSAFSARGPTGDAWLKPDLTAPGYQIVSAQAATGTSIAPSTRAPTPAGILSTPASAGPRWRRPRPPGVLRSCSRRIATGTARCRPARRTCPD